MLSLMNFSSSLLTGPGARDMEAVRSAASARESIVSGSAVGDAPSSSSENGSVVAGEPLARVPDVAGARADPSAVVVEVVPLGSAIAKMKDQPIAVTGNKKEKTAYREIN